MEGRLPSSPLKYGALTGGTISRLSVKPRHADRRPTESMRVVAWRPPLTVVPTLAVCSTNGFSHSPEDVCAVGGRLCRHEPEWGPFYVVPTAISCLNKRLKMFDRGGNGFTAYIDVNGGGAKDVEPFFAAEARQQVRRPPAVRGIVEIPSHTGDSILCVRCSDDRQLVPRARRWHGRREMPKARHHARHPQHDDDPENLQRVRCCQIIQ